MSTLRALLIESDNLEAARISNALSEAGHFVLAASGFDEASEALSVQKWDAILISGPHCSENLARFAAELRKMESNSSDSARTVLVCLAPAGSALSQTGFDVVLAQPFEASLFAQTVLSCAGMRQESCPVNQNAADDPPVFEPVAFAEQVGFDPDLCTEIIDLFLEERGEQLLQMAQALAAHDFPVLSRVAHTIKGSLGTLHAPRARLRAQELEAASKGGHLDGCQQLLKALETDIEDLIPELLQQRNS
jgi:two-component system sensor histidine kinase/response regulator